MEILRNPESIVASLGRSPFRRKFKLSVADRACVREQGMAQVMAYAQELIAQRLAPSEPENDGKQTPFRGHPVFVAQHGTGTCCRRCLEKWHHIPAGRLLSIDERHYIAAVIGCWLRAQVRLQSSRVSSTTAST